MTTDRPGQARPDHLTGEAKLGKAERAPTVEMEGRVDKRGKTQNGVS